ncbi:MAG: discoidin domain-containing protein, partial [Phycisphaerales bacterium]
MNVELRKRIVFVALVFGLSFVTQGKIVSRYSFTEGDTVAVDSVGGKDGILTETAVISGNKLVLDGGGAVELPGDVLDPNLESVTIEAWFEVGVAQNWQRLFDFGETVDGAGGNAIFYSPTSGAGDSRFVIATNGAPTWQTGEELVSGASVAPGTPTHVVCVYDGAVPEIRLYQDGVLVGITPTTMILANVARVFAYIGDATYTSDPYFNGTVDEFRIYGAALTAQEAQANFLAGPDEIPVGVVPKSFPLDRAKITASASSTNDPDTMGAVNTINGSGLVQGKHSKLETDMWLSALGDTDPWIQYDLDQAYKLHKVQVWNYNNSLEPQFGIGVNDVNIVYSLDGTNWMTLENVIIEQGTGSDDYEGVSVE